VWKEFGFLDLVNMTQTAMTQPKKQQRSTVSQEPTRRAKRGHSMTKFRNRTKTAK
jgi:hypothetical protein